MITYWKLPQPQDVYRQAISLSYNLPGGAGSANRLVHAVLELALRRVEEVVVQYTGNVLTQEVQKILDALHREIADLAQEFVEDSSCCKSSEEILRVAADRICQVLQQAPAEFLNDLCYAVTDAARSTSVVNWETVNLDADQTITVDVDRPTTAIDVNQPIWKDQAVGSSYAKLPYEHYDLLNYERPKLGQV